MVQVQEYLDVAHLGEHERPCDEEQRELAALVAQRESAFVAHDGVHHREACTKSAHEALDEHEPRDDARNGRSLDVDGEGSLVACPGLVGLLLEEDDSHDEVEDAYGDKVCFPFGDAGHEERSQRDKEGEASDNAWDDGDLHLVMQNAHDMHVQQAHESRDGVGGTHGEPDCDVGEPAGDGDGRRDGLELGVLQVGAQRSEGRDHENQEPVVERKVKVQGFEHFQDVKIAISPQKHLFLPFSQPLTTNHWPPIIYIFRQIAFLTGSCDQIRQFHWCKSRETRTKTCNETTIKKRNGYNGYYH